MLANKYTYDLVKTFFIYIVVIALNRNENKQRYIYVI
jgi:hypothetical protein